MKYIQVRAGSPAFFMAEKPQPLDELNAQHERINKKYGPDLAMGTIVSITSVVATALVAYYSGEILNICALLPMAGLNVLSILWTAKLYMDKQQEHYDAAAEYNKKN